VPISILHLKLAVKEELNFESGEEFSMAFALIFGLGLVNKQKLKSMVLSHSFWVLLSVLTNYDLHLYIFLNFKNILKILI